MPEAAELPPSPAARAGWVAVGAEDCVGAAGLAGAAVEVRK